MNTFRKWREFSGWRSMGDGRGAGARTLYLFQDDFITTESAPIASPRTSEPGPGTLTLTQTDGQYSISGDKLQIPAQATPVGGDLYFYGEKAGGGAFSRAAGRTLITKVRFSTLNTSRPISWSATSAFANNADYSLNITSAGGLVVRDGVAGTSVTVVSSGLTTGVDYYLALVLRSVGSYVLIKGGIFTNWTLVWVYSTGSAASLYVQSSNDSGVGTMDYIRVTDLGVPFSTDALKNVNTASPVNGNSYTGAADSIVDLTLTAAGTILTNGGFRFHVQDASNYWIAYFDTSLAFKVDSVTSGSPTNQVNVASVIAASGTRTVRAKFRGSTLDFYTLSGNTWTKRGPTLTNSAFSTQTTIQPDFGADWTAANLASYDASASAYNALDGVS